MREAIAGHGLEARIGINTGGVVVGGEGETLVTGDVANVAARLQQAATSGEHGSAPRRGCSSVTRFASSPWRHSRSRASPSRLRRIGSSK